MLGEVLREQIFDVLHGRYPSRKRGTEPSFRFLPDALPFVFGIELTRHVSVVQRFLIAECAHDEAFLQGTPMPEWEYISICLSDLPLKPGVIAVRKQTSQSTETCWHFDIRKTVLLILPFFGLSHQNPCALALHQTSVHA